MHELSIAESLIAQVEHIVADEGVTRVAALTLRIGALAGVDADALRFAFEIAARGTVLEDAALQIRDVPAAIYCAVCGDTVELPDIQHFRCPRGGTPSADVRQGRELMIDTLEVFDEAASP